MPKDETSDGNGAVIGGADDCRLQCCHSRESGNPLSSDAAFTLVEVTVAVVLMLIALGLLLSGFISSKQSVVLMQTRLTAQQIARTQVEQLHASTYTNIFSTSTILTNAFIRYTMSNSVVSVTNAVTDRYKNITITVGWMDPGSSRGQVLTNYMTICNPD